MLSDSGCCEALWIVFFAPSASCNEIFRNQNPSNSYMYMNDNFHQKINNKNF
jgi:hypothetical protein